LTIPAEYRRNLAGIPIRRDRNGVFLWNQQGNKRVKAPLLI
jgi:hypothetical protein